MHFCLEHGKLQDISTLAWAKRCTGEKLPANFSIIWDESPKVYCQARVAVMSHLAGTVHVSTPSLWAILCFGMGMSIVHTSPRYIYENHCAACFPSKLTAAWTSLMGVSLPNDNKSSAPVGQTKCVTVLCEASIVEACRSKRYG